jgi:uncharacterized protein (DUF1499 family)
MNSQMGRILIMGLLTTILTACAGERPKNLGVHNGRLAGCPGSPNCVSSQMADEAHGIAALTFDGEPKAAFTTLREILAGRSDTTIIEQTADYLRVEFRTTLFVDDGEFLLDGDRRCIEVRSASRLGYSDLGKNRSRLEEIRRQFAVSTGK